MQSGRRDHGVLVLRPRPWPGRRGPIPGRPYSGLALGNDAPLALPNHAETGASDQLRGAVSLATEAGASPLAPRDSRCSPPKQERAYGASSWSHRLTTGQRRARLGRSGAVPDELEVTTHETRHVERPGSVTSARAVGFAGTAWVEPFRRLRRCPGAERGTRCYLSALRAADVHAFVRSRRKFAWAVAMLETHSMSLDPGPRSRESETALRVDS